MVPPPTYIPLYKGNAQKSVTDRPRLSFKPVTPADLPAINRMVQMSPSRTCDYSAGGIFMWVDYFKYEYCLVADTLFIKGVAEDDTSRTALSLPVGMLPPDESIRLVLRHCAEQGLQPLFSAVPEDRIDLFTAISECEIYELTDWADYLYDIRALASLTGKSYSKKRNHVNRFMSDNPHWCFETLSPEILPETRLFFAGLDGGEKSNPALAAYEREQCAGVLRNFSSYPFEGAVLRGESGEIVAFTVGETIGDTLFVHIEKMNHRIAGAGETINKLFATDALRRHPSLRYVNREEDAGEPGLRRAKESYCPIMRLRKFNVAPLI